MLSSLTSNPANLIANISDIVYEYDNTAGWYLGELVAVEPPLLLLLLLLLLFWAPLRRPVDSIPDDPGLAVPASDANLCDVARDINS